MPFKETIRRPGIPGDSMHELERGDVIKGSIEGKTGLALIPESGDNIIVLTDDGRLRPAKQVEVISACGSVFEIRVV